MTPQFELYYTGLPISRERGSIVQANFGLHCNSLDLELVLQHPQGRNLFTNIMPSDISEMLRAYNVRNTADLTGKDLGLILYETEFYPQLAGIEVTQDIIRAAQGYNPFSKK
jgi:hypothetical protein